MKKIYILLLFVLALPLGFLQAQKYEGTIAFEQLQSKKVNDKLVMDVTFNLNDLKLHRQQMVTLTPFLISLDKTATYRFDPIVITGSKREKALNRALTLGDYQFEYPPQVRVRRFNKKTQEIVLQLEVPYSAWMRNAELTINENVTGCVNCDPIQNDYTLITPVLPPPFVPSYDVTYVTPPAEPVKQRSETYAARLNFEVGKFELLRNYKNNSNVLAEVDNIIREIQSDDNLTITDFKVTGYASPEGNFDGNMKLSENRARSFVNYLKGIYRIKDSEIKADWKGEDWDGLRKLVEESSISDKNDVLNLIVNEQNIAQRKNKLKALNRGTTYKQLLDEFYPPLRRNEYTIGYISRPFNIDEAKALVKTKPHHLSLNEMFLVANTYPKGSSDFKAVFDVATRLYPNDPIAGLNAGALEIENGAYDVAINRLKGIDLPEAWNNLGVAYAKRGDHKQAAEYFQRAKSAGNSTAASNLDQLNKWLEQQ